MSYQTHRWVIGACAVAIIAHRVFVIDQRRRRERLRYAEEERFVTRVRATFAACFSSCQAEYNEAERIRIEKEKEKQRQLEEEERRQREAEEQESERRQRVMRGVCKVCLRAGCVRCSNRRLPSFDTSRAVDWSCPSCHTMNLAFCRSCKKCRFTKSIPKTDSYATLNASGHDGGVSSSDSSPSPDRRRQPSPTEEDHNSLRRSASGVIWIRPEEQRTPNNRSFGRSDHQSQRSSARRF